MNFFINFFYELSKSWPHVYLQLWMKMTIKLKAILMRFQKNAFHHFSNIENSLTLSTQLILKEYFYMKKHDPCSRILKLHLQ